MKENRISIIINKSLQEVFDFSTDSRNTPKWIDNIKEERVNEWPIKIGTIYENTNNGKDWKRYRVIELEKNKFFTLKQQDSSYCVRYTYEQLDKNRTKVTYFEWDENEIENPFSTNVLEKLKAVIESL